MDPAVWGGARSQVRLWDWGQKLRENKISPRCPRRRRKKKAGAAQSTDAAAYCGLELKRAKQQSPRERQQFAAAADSSCRLEAAIASGCSAGDDEELLALPRRLVRGPLPSADGDGKANREAMDGMDGLDRMARTQWTIRWRLGVAKKDAAGPDPKEQGGSPHGKRLDQATEPWGQSLTAGSSAPASAVINC